MAGQLKTIIGPVYITNAAANIYTPAASTIYTVLKHMHFTNVTVGAATFTLYIGGTGGSTGGTEIFKLYPVAADSTYDFYCNIKMTSADFLTGLASASSTITIHISGEMVIV